MCPKRTLPIIGEAESKWRRGGKGFLAKENKFIYNNIKKSKLLRNKLNAEGKRQTLKTTNISERYHKWKDILYS